MNDDLRRTYKAVENLVGHVAKERVPNPPSWLEPERNATPKVCARVGCDRTQDFQRCRKSLCDLRREFTRVKKLVTTQPIKNPGSTSGRIFAETTPGVMVPRPRVDIALILHEMALFKRTLDPTQAAMVDRWSQHLESVRGTLALMQGL